MTTPKSTDPFGFRFWLGWILWFAGSFVLAAIFWTVVMTVAFGQIRGNELALTWSVSVFGSWFILLIPFMRKKEQIWKRLNQDEEKAVGAWLRAMGIFIGLLVASCLFWSFYFRGQIVPHPALSLPVRQAGLSERGFSKILLSPLGERIKVRGWIKAVLGTWLLISLPFLILMYQKADKIFRDAVVRQRGTGPKFRSNFLEKSKRLLPAGIAAKIQAMPETLKHAHVVTLILKSGERISNVFVLNSSEILGVYDRTDFDSGAAEIADVEATDLHELIPYEESKWLRLDGRT